MKILIECQLKVGKYSDKYWLRKPGERYYPGDLATHLVTWSSGRMTVLGDRAIALLGASRMRRNGVTIVPLPKVGPQWEWPKKEPTPVRPPLRIVDMPCIDEKVKRWGEPKICGYKESCVTSVHEGHQADLRYNNRLMELQQALEDQRLRSKKEREEAVNIAVKAAIASERDRVRVTRTIEYEGRRDWVESTMAKSISGKMECGKGTITETSRVVHTPQSMPPMTRGTKLGELRKVGNGDTYRWGNNFGWELFMKAVRCCELDDDGDGNCRLHSAPGVWRIGGSYGRSTTTTVSPAVEHYNQWKDDYDKRMNIPPRGGWVRR